MIRFSSIKLQFVSAVFCLLLSSLAFSQTAKDDLITMSKMFNKLKAFDMGVEVKVYKNESDLNPSFVSKGRTAKSNDKFYLYMLNRKTILNNKILLVVDDQQKLLLYSKVSDEQIKTLTNNQAINIDSIISSRPAEVSYIVNTEKEKRISVKSDDESIQSIILSLNPKSYALNEIIYLYTNEGKKNTGNSKVVVTYPNFALEAKSPELFNQSKYIVIGKKIVATAKYKNYRIINTEDFSTK